MLNPDYLPSSDDFVLRGPWLAPVQRRKSRRSLVAGATGLFWAVLPLAWQALAGAPIAEVRIDVGQALADAETAWLPDRLYALGLPDAVPNDAPAVSASDAGDVRPLTRGAERLAQLPPPAKGPAPATSDALAKQTGVAPSDPTQNGVAKPEGQPGAFSDLGKMFTFNLNGQAYFYDTNFARTPGSLLNPGNAYARLPNVGLTAELRPNLKATSEYVDFVLQPRASSIYQSGGVQPQETVRAYLQEGYVRLKPTDDISVVAGREVMTWGPAFFRSPSNPYYFNNERLDPILELSGIDLARVAYAVTPRLTVTGGVVFDSGHDLIANDSYRQSFLAKADYTASDYLASLNVASLRGESLFIGGYGQATVNDATLVYGEFGTSSSTGQVEIPPIGSGALFEQATNSPRSATALAGASYTLENGQTIYAEYLFNGFGYGLTGERQYFKQAGLARDDITLGGSLGGLATQGLGYAATRTNNLLGRHYVYLQYQNNPSQGDLLWRVMASENLVDFSAQPSVYVEQSVSDRASIFTLATANIGPRNSEFGALFRFNLMVGVKVFLF